MARQNVLSGDWTKIERFLITSYKHVLEEEVKKATIKNCLLIINAIKRNIRNRRFTKNTELTIALSGGDIPLLKEKNLFDAINYELKSAWEAEAGLIRNRKSTGGVASKPKGLAKIAKLIETGYTIQVTPKMRAAIMAALRKKGHPIIENIDSGGSGQKAKNVWRVPPRKFLSIVFKNHLIRKKVVRNWRDAVNKALKVSGAT